MEWVILGYKLSENRQEDIILVASVPWLHLRLIRTKCT
jgi:hypothetical protein